MCVCYRSQNNNNYRFNIWFNCYLCHPPSPSSARDPCRWLIDWMIGWLTVLSTPPPLWLTICRSYVITSPSSSVWLSFYLDSSNNNNNLTCPCQLILSSPPPATLVFETPKNLEIIRNNRDNLISLQPPFFLPVCDFCVCVFVSYSLGRAASVDDALWFMRSTRTCSNTKKVSAMTCIWISRTIPYRIRCLYVLCRRVQS